MTERRHQLHIARLYLAEWWTHPRTGYILRTTRACVLAAAAGLVLVPLALAAANV